MVFACSYYIVRKTRTEFSLHPRQELREGGNLWKLKFVTVGRTVALQPRPIVGCTASQLHCKVLQILPPTQNIYIYLGIYICILKKIPCPSLSTQKDLITLQKQQYPLWSIKTKEQTKKKHTLFFFKSVYLPIITNTAKSTTYIGKTWYCIIRINLRPHPPKY